MVRRSGRFGPVAAACVLLWLLAALPLAGRQDADKAKTNPLQGNPTALKQGQNIYRGRCAVCHGIDAKGYRGSDLTTGDWVHGGADAQIFETIRTGVPGTEMPGHGNMSEEEIWMVISYLRTLAAPGGPAPLSCAVETTHHTAVCRAPRHIRLGKVLSSARRCIPATTVCRRRSPARGRAPSSSRCGSGC